MTPEQLADLVVRSRIACHQVGCWHPATKVYRKTRADAHGGRTVYHYQRCDDHPVTHPDDVQPFNAGEH